jgi:thiol-disulfide isomerase/thioredoxin
VALIALDPVFSAPDAEQTPSARLAAIKKDFDAASEAHVKAFHELKDTAEGRKRAADLWKNFVAKRSALYADALQLATDNPKSDVAFEALAWMLTMPQAYIDPVGRKALRELTEHHAANSKIGTIVTMLGRLGPRENELQSSPLTDALFKAVLEKNSDRTVRGQVFISRAWQASRRFDVAEYKRSPQTEALATEAEQAFEVVVKDYDDCPSLLPNSKRTLGELARQELYSLRNLRVGKIAPDIEGMDLNGAKFKLTDSRSKVTMLVFWATWCGPCMAMVPHEREIAARMSNKPFTLVGVNGDTDREKAKQVAMRERMSWQSFWNGEEGSAGPISRKWNVTNWPTTYLIDTKGVIRFKDLPPRELDEAVDQLVKEAENEKK